MKWLETHKHLAIVIVSLIGLGVIANQVEKHRERMADKEQSGLQIKLSAADAQITKNDKDFSDFKTDILQKIGEIKTAKQGITILQPTVPGPIAPQVTKGDLPPAVQQQLPGSAGTHYNLFTDDQVVTLAKNVETCKIDERGLTTCEADKRTMQEKIDELTKANKKWEDVGAVPRWTVMAGVSKGRDGGYKPAAMLSYRITNHTGIAFGAVNNALVGGVNINFGGKPK